MSYVAVAAGVVSLAGAVVKGVNASKQRKEAARIAAKRPEAKESPYAKQQLGMAQNQLYANSPMLKAFQEGQMRAGAGKVKALQQSGGAENLIAGLANIQNSDNEANLNFAAQNDARFDNRMANLNNAFAANTQQHDQVYNNMVQNYQYDMGRKMALQNAADQNMASAFNDVSGSLIGMGQFGAFGSKAQNQLLGFGSAPSVGTGIFSRKAPASSWVAMSGYNPNTINPNIGTSGADQSMASQFASENSPYLNSVVGGVMGRLPIGRKNPW